MRKIAVLLKDNVENLGKKGEVVQISDGYARNYIVRKGFGVILDEKSKKSYDEKIAIERKKLEKSEQRATELKNDLEANLKLVFTERAGQEGKLFGAITSERILTEITKLRTIPGLDKKKLVLEEPIKTLGQHHVGLKLYHGVTANISIEVEELKE
jgi:large subunit ribosomal protein L9